LIAGSLLCVSDWPGPVFQGARFVASLIAACPLVPEASAVLQLCSIPQVHL
jgi:hypothetical protein